MAKCEQHKDDDSLQTPVEWHLAAYTSTWAFSGPIIERERISVIGQGGDDWIAEWGWVQVFGDTPLEAAMRCYVASKFGDEIDVPEELL